ncbi:winged helix-turn-helix domain-containing protein [Halegenticoccus tardaugens]|uniref:winged helix-turn-helix domain-containing protein n=1 Tax=Halegenticoccus tardaugens TaxID=2071624 RepID=UPI00100ACF6B|nr:winged helix-turn-helix domain-containing protein [Halegenticoccus tardaugens]
MAKKTELQRRILLAAYNNPRLSQSQIASRVGCSSSYVSQVLNRFDSLDAMEADIEQLNIELGFDPYADLHDDWTLDGDPDWYAGEDFNADIDKAIRDGVEGLKVLTKKTKILIRKLRD